VNFSLHRTPDGWKAWDRGHRGDFLREELSHDFGAEIEQKGLDEVISRLEAKTRPAPTAAAERH